MVAVVLSIVLLVVDQQSSRLANLRSGLSFIVYPILFAVDWPTKFISEISESAMAYSDLLAENKHLKEQQFISDSKLLKFAALEKENIRLRSLLDSSYKIGEQMLVAEILSVNYAPFDHVVLVNKGSRFGLHDKQPVFDTQGVVGQVIRTSPLSSEVMLITDPNHAIPVQINRNGLRTIAVGSGQFNQLILPFLPSNADVKPGDLLITSGMGGIFPQGYPVAVVNSVEAQPHKPFSLILATPKAALDKIREVLIVWSDSKSVPLNLPPVSSQATSTSTQPPEKPQNTSVSSEKIDEHPTTDIKNADSHATTNLGEPSLDRQDTSGDSETVTPTGLDREITSVPELQKDSAASDSNSATPNKMISPSEINKNQEEVDQGE